MHKENRGVICDTEYRVRGELELNRLQARYYQLIERNVINNEEMDELHRIEAILNDYLY